MRIGQLMKKNGQIIVLVLFTFFLEGGEGKRGKESSRSWKIPLEKSMVTDPRIGLRCKLLVKKKKLKQNEHRKATFLKSRVIKAQEKARSWKKSFLLQRLILIDRRLQQELRLLNLQKEKVEETIIRQGCPSELF